jgi:lactose/L-arabinose transport system ATP-binding protein
MNFLQAEVVDSQQGRIAVVLKGQRDIRLALPITSAKVEVGQPVTLGVRPEHFLEAGRGDVDMTVDVDVAEHLGNTSYIYANVEGGEQIVIEREESRNTGNRDKLTVALSAAKTFLFDSAGNRLR